MGAIQALSGKPINTKWIFIRVFLLGRCVLFKFISFSPWHFRLFAPPTPSPHPLVFPLFLTLRNSIAASAVCAFNLSAISQVFKGPFKFQENSRSAWLPYPNPNPDFQVKNKTKMSFKDKKYVWKTSLRQCYCSRYANTYDLQPDLP